MTTLTPQSPLPPAVLDHLRGVSTATLATQLFKRGFRTRFMMDVLPLRPELKMVGIARTLRCVPAREDLDHLEVFRNPEMPQRRAVELVGPGRCSVGERHFKLQIADCKLSIEGTSK